MDERCVVYYYTVCCANKAKKGGRNRGAGRAKLYRKKYEGDNVLEACARHGDAISPREAVFARATQAQVYSSEDPASIDCID